VKKLADDTYGKVERVTEIAPRARPKEPVQEAPRTVTLADPRVTQPNVSRYYLAPSNTSAKPGESEALDVLAHILGRGENSRLYQGLVIKKGIAITAGAVEKVKSWPDRIHLVTAEAVRDTAVSCSTSAAR